MPNNYQQRYRDIKKRNEALFSAYRASRPALPAGQPPVQGQTRPGQPPLPFMAIGQTKQGESYYAKQNGFKNWSRRMFARLFNPDFFYPTPTGQQQARIDEHAKWWESTLEDTCKWDKWAEPLFGIKSSEAAQAFASTNIAVDKEGKNLEGKDFYANRTGAFVGLAKRGIGQAFWSGLDVYGLSDQLVRRTIMPTILTVDYFSSAAVLPDAPARVPFSRGSAMWDMYRLANAIATGKLTADDLKDVPEIFKMNYQASNMAYTLLFNEQIQAEYYRRYQAGEDSQMLSQELANPWIELGGSILGDPMTYIGLSLPSKGGKILGIGAKADDVARTTRPLIRVGKYRWGKTAWSFQQVTPTLGEMLHLNVGRGRLLNTVDDTVNPSPEIENALKGLNSADNDADAVVAVRRAVTRAVAEVNAQKKQFGFVSYTAASRINLMSGEASHFLQTVFSNGDIDEGFEILDSWHTLMRGTDAEKLDAFRRLSNTPYGTVLISPGALRTAEIVATMKDSGQVDKIMDGMRAYRIMKRANKAGMVLEDAETLKLAKWYENAIGNDSSKLMDMLTKDLDNSVRSLIPTVNEMKAAAKEVSEAKKTGAKVSEATERLAKAYKQVPEYAKAANAVNESYGKIHRWLQGKFVKIQIAWGSLAYPIKNVIGQGTAASLDGIPADITSTAMLNMWSNKNTARVVDQYYSELKNMLGHVPEGAMRATSGSAEAEIVAGKWDFAVVAANADHMQGVGIINHVVQEEILKGLRGGGIPPVEELRAAGFSNADIGLLYTSALDNYGWGKRVESEYMKLVSRGSFDTWRNIRLNPALEGHLRTTDMLGDMKVALKAETQADFDIAIERMIAKNRARAMTGGGVPGVSESLNPVVSEAVLHAQKHAGQYVGEEEADLFTRLAQKRDELRQTLIQAAESMKQRIYKLLPEEQGRQMSAEITQVMLSDQKTTQLYRGLQEYVSGLSKKVSRGDIRYEQVWNMPFGKTADGKPLWSIADFSPEIPADKNEFYSALWRSYYAATGKLWDNSTKRLLDVQRDIFQKYSELAGMNFDDIARASGRDQLNIFEELDRVRREGDEISEMWVYSRQFKTVDFPKNATLMDLELGANARLVQEIPSLAGKPPGVQRKIILNMVNKDRVGLEKYVNYADVPIDEAIHAVARRAKIDVAESADEVARAAEAIDDADNVVSPTARVTTYLRTHSPPYIPGSQPNNAQVAEITHERFAAALEAYADEVRGKWGVTAATSSPLDDAKQVALRKWTTELNKRGSVVRMKSELFANSMRDFILHDYNKTYGDLAVAFLLPYHYWYNRTYVKFFERILYDPKIASLYLKYRQFLEKEYAGLPEYWRYNVPITFLPGTSAENPLFFNLEATLNPLYGLTGVDFEDPHKRVDWLSSSLDDMQKFGPSLFTPIQWLVALKLYKDGERDAAERWLGRMFPQTTTIKAALNLPLGKEGKTGVELLGLDKFPEGTPISGLRHGEFDPFVNLFMGGHDPYEQTRISRALAWMVQEGKITPEDAIDASWNRSGEEYDIATTRAIQQRAPGQLFSFALGVGFKPRSKEDMEVDKFYQEYSQLLSMRGTMSPDDYRRSWDTLRDKYPFMDTVLVGGKAVEDKDAAYSYNVLSRIPPGQATEILNAAGINNEMINKFYEGKGSFEGWTPQDRKRFIAGMVDIGAMLKMPDLPMRQEWTDAKIAYQDMQDLAKSAFGDGIYDKVDAYYNLESGVPRRDYLDAHPEVKALMAWQDQYIVSNPLLSKYYGGLDTVDRFYSNMMYADLTAKYGADISQKWEYYYQLQATDPRAARAYYSQHPELKKYSRDKAVWEETINRAYVSIGSHLDNPAFQFRDDFTPQSQYQKDLQAAAEKKQMTWAEWKQELPPYMQNIVYSYWKNGIPLSYAAKSELDYLASRYGMNGGDELLRAIGVSLGK
jgi:hypothetical protein